MAKNTNQEQVGVVVLKEVVALEVVAFRFFPLSWQ